MVPTETVSQDAGGVTSAAAAPSTAHELERAHELEHLAELEKLIAESRLRPGSRLPELLEREAETLRRSAHGAPSSM